jgi:hypothetical protein
MGDTGLSRRRDKTHDARKISGHKRLACDVEGAHVIAKARRKGAFQIVNCVEIVADELKAQPGGHFLQGIFLLLRQHPLAGAIMPRRIKLGTSSLKSPMRFCAIVSSPPIAFITFPVSIPPGCT